MDLYADYRTFFRKNRYSLTNVSEYIGKNFEDFRYYSQYNRKECEETPIYRFYKRNETGKKITISVLPAFLLSRKRKSLKIFFELLKLSSSNNYSIEQVLNIFDKDVHFSKKTFIRYTKCLTSQLDEAIKLLTTGIIKIDNRHKAIEIQPDETHIKLKIKLLLDLIDQFVDLIQQKKLMNEILYDEYAYYFQFHFFSNLSTMLLRPP